MKTLLAILTGGENSPKLSVRHLGIGMIYVLGLAVVLLQLRSVF